MVHILVFYTAKEMYSKVTHPLIHIKYEPHKYHLLQMIVIKCQCGSWVHRISKHWRVLKNVSITLHQLVRYGEGKLKSMSDGSGGGGGGSSSRSEERREDIVNGWSIIRKHENNMKTLFLNETSKMRNLNVYGVTNVQNVSDRTATFGISVDGLHPEDLCTKLTDKGIYCTSGNHYCTFWDTFEEGGGGKNTALNSMDGVTRIGFLHYNTINDVQNVLNVLQDICKDAAK